jgi:hypothetical protein
MRQAVPLTFRKSAFLENAGLAFSAEVSGFAQTPQFKALYYKERDEQVLRRLGKSNRQREPVRYAL